MTGIDDMRFRAGIVSRKPMGAFLHEGQVVTAPDQRTRWPRLAQSCLPCEFLSTASEGCTATPGLAMLSPLVGDGAMAESAVGGGHAVLGIY